ncbi:MAG: SpoIVB peptidase [Clostridia bacterium]|nr:SpoIVB peptidase [Clostridia bacterium]
MKEKTKKLLCALFAVVCVILAAASAADAVLSDGISVFEGEDPYTPAFSGIGTEQVDGSVIAYAFGVPVKRVSVSVYKTKKVILGGQSFGVKLKMRGVQIVGIGVVNTPKGPADPASSCGLQINDVITEVDGKTVTGSEMFTKTVENCGGRPVKITYLRGGEEKTSELLPVQDEQNVYKAGLWIKDTTAGIGTVTYTLEDGFGFGGLGHGICDPDSSALLPFAGGEVYEAHITGIRPGRAGDPGELRGYFGKEPTGELLANEQTGVYGRFERRPDGKTVQIALNDKVREGDAKIVCTTGDDGVREYDAQITCILSRKSETKNFIVRVTDKELLSRTGGIVQGMSGSPILQDGKLIGAVTHVLVNDPTRGYGIFIENMLKYSE